MPLADKESSVMPNSSSMIAPLRVATRRTRRNLPLIIKREYIARIQQRSFQITTVVLLLIAIIGASFPTILALITSRAQTQMVIINTAGKISNFNDQSLLAFLNTSLNAGYDSTQQGPTLSIQKAHFALRLGSTGELETFRQEVRDNKLSILLQIIRDHSDELEFMYYTNNALSQNTDLSQVQAVAKQLQIQDKLSHLNIGQIQATSLYTPPIFQATSVLQEQNGRSPAENNAAIIVAMSAIVLLFIFIQQYCTMVSTGVAEEKDSRIIEILINVTTPFQLLLGKIIGVGLVGITQMSLIWLVGSATLLAQTPLKQALNIETDTNLALPNITTISFDILGLLALYFVLGFLLYAALYAAAGALVSRQEEVTSSVGPLAFLIMASYLVSFYATITPKADWVVLLSYVPFFTPMMMLAREASTSLSWWEITLSSALMVAAIIGFTWLAAYIYRVGILMYGQKPGFGAFFSYIRR